MLEGGVTSLHTLKSLATVFPASESKFVWAVENTLDVDGNLLKAKRSVSNEPEVLVSQLEAIARAMPEYSDSRGLGSSSWNQFVGCLRSPRVRVADLKVTHHIEDIEVVLKELASRHKGTAEQLLKKLSDLAYVPCQSDGPTTLLFSPKHAACSSAQGPRKLLPAFGVALPQIQQLAWATGTPKWMHVEALVDAVPCFGKDLAIALCAELAEQADVEGFARSLRRLKVPTNSKQFLPIEHVYINDAQWKGAGDVQTLGDRISHDHGQKLGCKSVRERLKKECEDGTEDEDAFGQEADLVDQVGLLKLPFPWYEE